MTIFECLPIKKLWSPGIPGECMSITTVVYIQGVISIVTDLCMYLLPIKSVLNLNISTSRKVGVITIFAVGFL